MNETTSFDPQILSRRYAVRPLDARDVERIYALCRENRLFYEYHPPFVTRERVAGDLAALPPGAEAEDKQFLGFFEGEHLVALCDLILRWPEKETAYIGLFMTDARLQGRGIGSAIVQDMAASLQIAGFRELRLGVDRGNPQSFAFWHKNGFSVRSEGEYIVMTRRLKG